MAGWTGTLVPGENQQLRVDDQQFGGSFFKEPARLDARTNHIEPVDRNGFDTFLAASHKSEGPEWMTVPFSAVAGRLSATAVRKRKRAWKGITGDLEASDEEASAAAEAGGFGAVRGRRIAIGRHLLVILLSDRQNNKTSRKCFLQRSSHPRWCYSSQTFPVGASPKDEFAVQ